MPDRRPTDSILPLADPPDTLTMDTLRRAERKMRMLEPTLFMRPSLVERFRDTPMESAAEHLFGPRLGSYMGLTVLPAPRLYRPPEKPFRSRPRRKHYMRASWVPVRAPRVKLKARTLVSWRGWKGRKVPDRTGYPPNSVFVVDPRAIFSFNPLT